MEAKAVTTPLRTLRQIIHKRPLNLQDKIIQLNVLTTRVLQQRNGEESRI